MLPKDLQDKARRIVPSATWRLPDLYSLLGQIQVSAGKARNVNDYPQWKKAENLGEEIFEWISTDNERKGLWEKICEEKQGDFGNMRGFS